jgi:hypothetical protein
MRGERKEWGAWASRFFSVTQLKTLAPAIEKQLSVDEVFHLFSMFGLVLRQQPLSLFPTI